MTLIETIIEFANKQHTAGRLSDEELIDILEQLVNATALENGYADEYGLPFPKNQDEP